MAPATGLTPKRRLVPSVSSAGGILVFLLLLSLMLGQAAAQPYPWSYTVEYGTDYPGNDMNVPTGDAVCSNAGMRALSINDCLYR